MPFFSIEANNHVPSNPPPSPLFCATSHTELTAPGALPESTAPVGALLVAGEASKAAHTDAKLQPKDAVVSNSLWTVFAAKG
jgi:hypothetical protein